MKIGLTGSLASGKTTASKIISSRRGPLFSADKEVKKLYTQKSFKNLIVKKFKLQLDKSFKKEIKKKILQKKKKFKKIRKNNTSFGKKRNVKIFEKKQKKKVPVF